MNTRKLINDFTKVALPGICTAVITGLTVIINNHDSYYEDDNEENDNEDI